MPKQERQAILENQGNGTSKPEAQRTAAALKFLEISHLMPDQVPQRPKRFTWVVLAFLGAAVCAAFLLGWLSEEVVEGNTMHFDLYARSVVHSASTPFFTSVMWFFTILGSVGPTIALLAAALVLFWFLRLKRAMVVLSIAMAGAVVLDLSLKYAFHRARPAPFFGITAPSSFSYPSGHALFAFTFYATVATLVWARIRRHWLRLLLWAVAATVIACIGFSRVYLGVHYPTDVIAGYLTAFVWVFAISFADRLRRRESRD